MDRLAVLRQDLRYCGGGAEASDPDDLWGCLGSDPPHSVNRLGWHASRAAAAAMNLAAAEEQPCGVCAVTPLGEGRAATETVRWDLDPALVATPTALADEGGECAHSDFGDYLSSSC